MNEYIISAAMQDKFFFFLEESDSTLYQASVDVVVSSWKLRKGQTDIER